MCQGIYGRIEEIRGLTWTQKLRESMLDNDMCVHEPCGDISGQLLQRKSDTLTKDSERVCSRRGLLNVYQDKR